MDDSQHSSTPPKRDLRVPPEDAFELRAENQSGNSELHVLADAIIATIPTPLLVLDKSLTVLLANDAFFNHFRVLPLHTIGQPIWSLGNGQWSTPGFMHLMNEIIPRGASLVNYEISHDFPNIGQRIVLLNGRVILPVAGESRYLLLIIQDVTAERAAEMELHLLNQQLQRRNEEIRLAYDELETFSYSVSHDLRSPLRAIDGFSHALEADYGGSLDDKAKDYLGRIRRGTQRMAELIDAILELSRISRTGFNPVEVDLRTEAGDIMTELRRSNPAREVEFTLPDRARAVGDQRLLRIALTNLLSNAWKFTSQVSPAVIEFGVQDGELGKVYFVRDNGIGFDQRHAERIFQPFSQLRAADFAGSGIGLSTTYRVIRRHRGRIWAEGKRNGGATFYFTIGQPS